MATHNSTVIARGHKKAMFAIKLHILKIGFEYAKRALYGAVRDWDELAQGRANLTGNTRNGFVAAVYWDGKLFKEFRVIGEKNNPLTVSDIEGYNVKDITSRITKPGMGGFIDYSSGEEVESVRNYNPETGLSFQTQGFGLVSKELSLSFVNHPPISLPGGMLVVVANCTPYGEYLVAARDLDILTSQSESSRISSEISASIAHLVKYIDKMSV